MAQNTEIAKAIIDLDGQQAGQELKNLEDKAAQLRKELNRLNKENDLAGYKKKEAELKQVNKQMGQYKTSVVDVTRVLKNLNGTSLKDLEKAKKALVSQTRLLNRNTAEYIEKSKQLKLVQSEIGKVKSEMFGAQKAAGGLGGMFLKLKTLIFSLGLSLGAIGIFNFFKRSVEMGDVQVKKEEELLVALKGRKSVQLALIEQAKQLQKITLFGDEETVQAQALIAAFTKEESSIKRIIPLVQDLATAKGMDLAAAADLVSKTLGSSTNALARYGIQVTGAVGSSERLETLVKALTAAFGGQAEAAAKVGKGPLTQLKNILGDIREDLGIKMMPSIAKFANALKDIIAPATEYVDKLREEQIQLNSMVLKLTDTNTKEEERAKIIKYINDHYPDLFKNIDLEKASYGELETVMKNINDEFEHRIALTLIEEDLKKQQDKINKKYEERSKIVDELNSKLAEMILFIRTNADKVDASMVDVAKNTEERINVVSGLLADLRDQGEQIPEGYNQYLTLLDQNVALLDTQLDKEKEIESYIKTKLETYKEIMGLEIEEEKVEKGKTETEAQRQARKKKMLDALEIAYREEVNALKQSYLDKQVSTEEYNQKSDELQVANLAARKALMEKFGEDITEIEQQILDKKIAIWEKELRLIEEYARKREEAKNKAQSEGEQKRIDVYNKEADGEAKIDKRGAEAWEKKKKAEEAARQARMESLAQETAYRIENAKTVEEAAKNVINSVRNEIKAYIAKAIAAAIAKEIGTKGILGIITAIAATSAITLLFNNLIPEFYTGGPTGKGDKYEPRGIVHAGEYVIAREELEQADIKQYVKGVIEPRRVNRLNFSEIGQAIQLNRSFASGGSADQGATQPQIIQSQSINESKLDRMIALLEGIYEKSGKSIALFNDTTIEKITERQNLISEIKRRVSRNKN